MKLFSISTWIIILVTFAIALPGCKSNSTVKDETAFVIEFQNPRPNDVVSDPKMDVQFMIKGEKPVAIEEFEVWMDNQIVISKMRGLVGKTITIPMKIAEGGHRLLVKAHLGNQEIIKKEIRFAYSPAHPTGMTKIPGGEFMMGCSQGDFDCEDQEKPSHLVMIQPFFMDTTEVTNGQWKNCLKLGVCRHPDSWTDSFDPKDDQPVTGVRWSDAQSYCTFEGKALPTEAQWEYAARAGTTTPYYGPLDDIAWYNKNAGDKFHPVGQKKPNAWGLFDMLGNVNEWCEDLYFKMQYSRKPDDPHKGASDGRYRVMRGGSWFHSAKSLRVSTRFSFHPEDGGEIVGFRCVKNIPSSDK